MLERGRFGNQPVIAYFFGLTVCLAAAAVLFFLVLVLALACFCAACLFVAFGDLSPIII